MDSLSLELQPFIKDYINSNFYDICIYENIDNNEYIDMIKIDITASLCNIYNFLEHFGKILRTFSEQFFSQRLKNLK